MENNEAIVKQLQTEGLEITRIFNAPRTLVWQAWTQSKHIAAWWGPNGFTNPVCNWDAKAGNAIMVHMKAPDGTVYPMGGVFQEVVEPEELVFVSAALGPDSKPLFEVLNTVTFTDLGSKTKLTMHARVLNAGPEAPQYLKGMEQGWGQSLDKFANYLVSIS